MKPFAILTQYLKFQRENKPKEDYKPEKNGPGLTQSATASARVRLHNILKMHVFPDVLALEKKPFPSLRKILQISYF